MTRQVGVGGPDELHRLFVHITDEEVGPLAWG